MHDTDSLLANMGCILYSGLISLGVLNGWSLALADLEVHDPNNRKTHVS